MSTYYRTSISVQAEYRTELYNRLIDALEHGTLISIDSHPGKEWIVSGRLMESSSTVATFTLVSTSHIQ